MHGGAKGSGAPRGNINALKHGLTPERRASVTLECEAYFDKRESCCENSGKQRLLVSMRDGFDVATASFPWTYRSSYA